MSYSLSTRRLPVSSDSARANAARSRDHQVGGAQQQRAPLPFGGAGPGARRRRPGARRRSPSRCRRACPRTPRDDGTVCGATNLATAAGHRVAATRRSRRDQPRLHPSGRKRETLLPLLMAHRDAPCATECRARRDCQPSCTRSATPDLRAWTRAPTRQSTADPLTERAGPPAVAYHSPCCVLRIKETVMAPRPAPGREYVLTLVLPRHARARPRRQQLPGAAPAATSARASSSTTGTPAASSCGCSSASTGQRRWRSCAQAFAAVADAFQMAWQLHDAATPTRTLLHGVAVRPLPQRPAVPRQHRRAAHRDPRRRVQPPRLRGAGRAPTASFHHSRSPRTPRRRPRRGCSTWSTSSTSTWSCWPATCRCCPTTCAPSSRAGPSTSTTPSCRASRAPSPTTRRTPAASS